MTLHLFLHFIHVVGALVAFAGIGVEIVALRALRRASIDDVRRAIPLFSIHRWLGPVMTFTLLVPGIALTMMSWGWQPWILVSLAGLVVIVVLGAGVTGGRMRRLERALDEHKGDESGIEKLARDPVLVAALLARIGLAVAIVFVMTMKPDMTVALVAVVAGACLGLVSMFGGSTSG